MPFGGGGGGGTITAHRHSNEAGEGGSLDGTSLMLNSQLLGMIIALGRRGT